MLANWFFGNWQKLIELDIDADLEEGKRAQGYLLKSSAYFAIGKMDAAKHLLQEALARGTDPVSAARIMLSGVQTTLARAEFLRGNHERGKDLLESSMNIAGGSEIAESAIRSRQLQELSDLGLLPDAVELINDEHKQLLNSQELQSVKDARATTLASEIEVLNWQIALLHKREQLYTANSLEQSHTQLTVDSQESKTKSKKAKSSTTIAQQFAHLRRKSTAQLGQDLWALERHNFKRGGYFVEFGATDGILLSNTYLLEQHFGWGGVCAEPNPEFFSKLRDNRQCVVADDCISGKTGETVEFVLAHEFGGIADYNDTDHLGERRKAYHDQGQILNLVTISLNDFLLKHKAPKKIDYLSVDTEGNELDILLNFDFDRWKVGCLTVEHNYTENREKIYQLLKKHGYERTEAKWDDWYYLPD